MGEVKIGGHEEGEGRKSETDDKFTTPDRKAKRRGVNMKVETGVRLGGMMMVVEDDKSVPPHCP